MYVDWLKVIRAPKENQKKKNFRYMIVLQLTILIAKIPLLIHSTDKVNEFQILFLDMNRKIAGFILLERILVIVKVLAEVKVLIVMSQSMKANNLYMSVFTVLFSVC